MKQSEASTLLWIHLMEEIPIWAKPTREWRFCDRKWRFDFAVVGVPGWPQRPKLGIEIEGGAFTHGRHTRGAGFVKDLEKYNHATLLGWKVLRFTPQQVLKGEAIAFIKLVLETSEECGLPSVTTSSS